MKKWLLLLWPLIAFGQSIPNGTIIQGEVWTPAQWNAAWQAKLDFLPPLSGQLLLGNAGGTAYAAQTIGGDCTVTSSGTITCTNSNGTVIPTNTLSPAETSVGITSGNIATYLYAPGDPRRYGAAACATYGACTTGDTDSTAAMNLACKLGNVNIFYYYYRVTSTVTCSFTQGLITFTGGAFLQATNTFSGYVLTLSGNQMLVINAGIDAGALSISGSTAGGITVTGGSDVLIAPYAVHFHGSGVNGMALASTFAGDSMIIRGYANEWLNSDSQFSTDANFTATALYVNRADCYIVDSTFRWSGVNVFIDSSSATTWITHSHFYNGRPGGPARVDPINVHVAQGASNIFFQGIYFDDGHVDLYSPGVSIKDSYLLHNTVVATFSDNDFIRVYANGQIHPYQLDMESILTQLSSPDLPFAYVSCLSSNPYCNTGTTYNWTGDYSGLPTFIGSQTFANLRADNVDEFLCHNAAQSFPCKNNYKPNGTFTENYQIGNSTPSAISYALGTFTVGDPLTTLDIGGPLALSTGGSISAPSWTTNGLAVSGSARTLTDTTGSGTIGAEAGAALPTYTIAASAAGVTITNLDELYLPAPVAGTNVTAGTLWSLHTAAGIRSGGILTGALGTNFFGATASINNNSNFNTLINTGTSTGTITLGNAANVTPVNVAGALNVSTGGAMSAPSWTTSGITVSGTTATLTDTTGSGTIPIESAAALPQYTIATTASSVTVTNLDELYLPAPVAGTNVTATSLWSLQTGGGVRAGGILTGALGENIFGATASINNNSNFNTQVNTGTSTGNVAIGNTSGPSTTTMVGATTINASANAATSLNTGTSTGAVHIADGSGNNAVTIGNGTGSVSIKAPLISAAGTAFTVASGTATCGTTSTLHGGVQAGDFTCTTAGTAASTVTLTIAATTTAYTCWGRDITTPTTVTQTGAKSTTSVTLTLTSVTANDVIQFGCLGY